MKIKKILALFLVLCMFTAMVGCAAKNTTETPQKKSSPASESQSAQPSNSGKSSSPTFEGENVRLALLSGSTGLGASKLIVDAKAKNTVNDYAIEVIADPTAVIAGIKTGKYDLAALPVNVAAKLYNMPDVEVQVVALNTLGVLYVLETETKTVTSVASLKGKTIYTTGEGATPQYILEYVLNKNGLTVGSDVTVIYRATADEVQADAQTSGAVVMLPEPKATVVTKAMTNVSYALDMTTEWDKVADSKLTQGCIVATKSFAQEHKQALDAFLGEYKLSVEFINKADDSAAQAVVDAGIIGKAPVAKIAIPKSNLVCYEGNEMKTALSGTLSVLHGLNPASVGGKLPGDDFYYQK